MNEKQKDILPPNARIFYAKVRGGSQMKLCRCDDPKHELALAFFDPEVMLQYTSLPSKYEVSCGYILSKKERWILQSCYVNPFNEVYCYLYDLSLLPESEQDHWKSRNLANPRGFQSGIAISRDFMCKFSENSVGELRIVLKEFSLIAKSIWKPKENSIDEMISKLHPPVIEEYELYRSFIGALARATTEGFILKELKKLAGKLGIELEEKLGSLGVLKRCIQSLTNEEQGKIICDPLFRLHREKSAISSHGGERSVQPQSSIEFADNWILEITDVIERLTQIISEQNEAVLPT